MRNATMQETDPREAAHVFGPSRWWSAAARERFIAAMQPALELRHPNLIGTQAISERGDTVVIVTDDVIGVTLESILAAEPVQSIDAVASILTQVAAALEYAHAKGVAHGAISSSCVLVDENGDAMVTDIGVAAAIAAAGVHGDFGDSPPPAYASPELHRGDHPSAASDQYALGALAYEMLAGRGAVDASAGWLHRMQLRWHPGSMDLSSSDVPEEWSRAVKRMLEPRPANRFPSITDAVRVFARANDGQDQRFRGPLGWIVKQQLSGAMPSEDDLRDAEAAASPFASIDAPIAGVIEQRLREAVRRQSRLLSHTVGTRRRVLGSVVFVALVGAVAWWQIPPSTVDRVQGDIKLEVSQLESPRSAGGAITAASPASVAPDPVPAETQPVESLPPVAPPAAHATVVKPPPPVEHHAAVAAHRPAAAPPKGVERRTVAAPPPRHTKTVVPTVPSPGQSAATHTLNVEARPHTIATKPATPPQQSVVVTSLGGLPGGAPASPSTPPSTPPAAQQSTSIPPASAASASVPAERAPAPSSDAAVKSAPPATPSTLSAGDAILAASKVVDQLRTSSVHALGASMVPSREDEAFLDWLGRRPVSLDVGSAPAPRVTLTQDGGAQVHYDVPITWTHASGARPARTATIVVAVRPTADGPPVVAWSLTQPFVP